MSVRRKPCPMSQRNVWPSIGCFVNSETLWTMFNLVSVKYTSIYCKMQFAMIINYWTSQFMHLKVHIQEVSYYEMRLPLLDKWSFVIVKMFPCRNLREICRFQWNISMKKTDVSLLAPSFYLAEICVFHLI